MIKYQILIFSLFLFGNTMAQLAPQPKAIDSLVSQMSQEEKIDFISGYKNFNIKANTRLGIPQIKMADGPMGINGHGKATAFPANICMAATWNPDLIEQAGAAIAEEAKQKGIGILLAPGVNNYRIPQCGRNFEYYGEDPYLSAAMVVSFIQGVQSKKVMATVKHFVANNHDYDRHRVSSNIDERTLNEIYFPPFKAAVQEAQVGAIMTSYNLVNGIHTSESKYLMQEVLREDWGFEGIIMSDWISVYSMNAFQAGLDLEMPRPQFMNAENVDSLIQVHPEYNTLLDGKVKRILSTCQRIGLYDTADPAEHKPQIEKDQNFAQKIAEEGVVLLKNEGQILPLQSEEPQKILVMGPNAKYTPYSGGGAAHIQAERNISFLEGIKKEAPENYSIDYLNSEGLFLCQTETDRQLWLQELQKAKDYQSVILCLGFHSKTEGEAFDRPFSLPENQVILLEELSKIQENIILVINAGGGVFMPWLKKPKALLHAWYLGQEGGTALGNIIFGKVNPSGKLPISIEKYWKDNAAFQSYDSTHALPGAQPFYTLYGQQHEIIPMAYEEGIFTGYRHYDQAGILPLFAFGYGLSYTQFEFSNLQTNKQIIKKGESIQISIDVENIGDRDGAETIQLYISDLESSIPRPLKELKSFQKIFIKKGEKKSISFQINPKMLEFYHPDLHLWTMEEGTFEVLIGNSSQHIHLQTKIYLK